MAAKGSTGGGSATSYDGTGAGAGGFGSTAFSRPNEATPRSVVDARVARSDTPDDAGKSEQAERADQLRIAPAPSGMPDPLPTSPFLKRTAT